MCAAGEFGESKWAPMAPSSTPSLRRSSTLNSWRRVAERLAGGGHQRKGGGVAGPFTGAIVWNRKYHQLYFSGDGRANRRK